MAKNRVIGIAGRMPWDLPEERQRFKQLTMGQSLLMGRKTFESIGRPLPGRQMIVLSRNPEYRASGCQVVNTLQAGLAAADRDELFICGGAEIYRQALPLAERIYLTELQRNFVGDRYFPELPPGQFFPLRTLTLVENGERYLFSVLQRQR